jgi:hypothetical protein
MPQNRLIDTARLIPMPQDDWGAVCSECHYPRANWQWLTADLTTGTSICALCYLYNSDWGKAQGPAMSTLLKELETGVGLQIRAHHGG